MPSASPSVIEVFSRCPSGNITVLSGAGYFYERSDPSKGYFIRSYRGDNIAAILSAYTRDEPNADLLFRKNPGIAQHSIQIFDSSRIIDAASVLYTCSAWDFGGWEKVLRAVRRLQQWARRTVWLKYVARARLPRNPHSVFGYKMAYAFFASSDRGRHLPFDVRSIVLRHYERLRRASNQPQPVARIETKSFREF